MSYGTIKPDLEMSEDVNPLILKDQEKEDDSYLEEEDENEEDEEEEFYTPGTDLLLKTRHEILNYSLYTASKRIEAQRILAKKQDLVKTLKHRRQIVNKLKKTELYGSQSIIGRTRALSKIRSNIDKVAVGCWDGSLSILDRKTLKLTNEGIFHTEKCSALDWNSNMIVTGGGDGSIAIWNSDATQKNMEPLISNRSAHDAYRVTDVKYHPSKKYIASTSFDKTWKLWDANNLTQIYQQEGHSKEIQCGNFHPDGGLFFSGGLDFIGRLWDLRSGKSIAVLQGHAKGIYSADFSINGIHLATASADATVKIWDMRNLNNTLCTIPAHKKLVSDVRFANNTHIDVPPVTNENGEDEESLDTQGSFLISSSFDGDVNIWNADNWIKITSLSGHTDKVMSCDVNSDGTIVSCGWDRTVKLWS